MGQNTLQKFFVLLPHGKEDAQFIIRLLQKRDPIPMVLLMANSLIYGQAALPMETIQTPLEKLLAEVLLNKYFVDKMKKINRPYTILDGFDLDTESSLSEICDEIGRDTLREEVELVKETVNSPDISIVLPFAECALRNTSVQTKPEMPQLFQAIWRTEQIAQNQFLDSDDGIYDALSDIIVFAKRALSPKNQ